MTRKSRSTDEELKVGDRVRRQFVAQQLVGVIVHDYGALGPDGSRLVRVRIENTEYDREFDWPADELEAA